jgi:hypothetical protein
MSFARIALMGSSPEHCTQGLPHELSSYSIGYSQMCMAQYQCAVSRAITTGLHLSMITCISPLFISL